MESYVLGGSVHECVFTHDVVASAESGKEKSATYLHLVHSQLREVLANNTSTRIGLSDPSWTVDFVLIRNKNNSKFPDVGLMLTNFVFQITTV